MEFLKSEAISYVLWGIAAIFLGYFAVLSKGFFRALVNYLEQKKLIELTQAERDKLYSNAETAVNYVEELAYKTAKDGAAKMSSEQKLEAAIDVVEKMSSREKGTSWKGVVRDEAKAMIFSVLGKKR